MCKKLLITLIFVLGSVPAFAQVDTAGTKRYDGAQDSREAAKYMPDDSCCVLRGDCDDDGKVTVTDVDYLVNCLFLIHDWCCPECPEECDLVGDGSINITDLSFLVDYLFNNGPAPPPC